jgi:hypothetical protein
VRNIMMLDVRCLVPGHGWGCVVCNLPPDGASAVLCDPCLRKYRNGSTLRFACRGWPADDGRAPLARFSQRFEHDERLHAENERSLR